MLEQQDTTGVVGRPRKAIDLRGPIGLAQREPPRFAAIRRPRRIIDRGKVREARRWLAASWYDREDLLDSLLEVILADLAR